MSETLVRVENVSKKFCKSLKRSLWYGMKDLGNELIGRSHGGNEELRPDEFWAVEDISFELKRGECLGLIGPNGAGKSTLLKMLNGLIKPDRGRIEMRGRVEALIELGSGFNPILTGRENIYVNGAVLGFTKEEVDRKFDEIIEFAEIDEFIDTPVQYYSSGMKVRLGFAIAAQMEPDVLLIDEILAVGDIGFKAKCFNEISNMINKAAVIFVSHSMPHVSRICSRILLMNHGESFFQGINVPKGIDVYYSYFKKEESLIIGGEKARIIDIRLLNNGRYEVESIDYLDELSIHILAEVDIDVKYPNFIITIYNQELQIITQCSSFYNQIGIQNKNGEISLSINLGKINLNPANYVVEVAITRESHGEILLKHMAIANFKVNGPYVGYAPVQILADWEQT